MRTLRSIRARITDTRIAPDTNGKVLTKTSSPSSAALEIERHTTTLGELGRHEAA